MKVKLRNTQVQHINTLIDFLAIVDELPNKVDLTIVLGSAMVDHLNTIAKKAKRGELGELMLVGGIGHSTNYLYENIANHKVYQDLLDKNLSESELYYKILTKCHGVNPTIIHVENKSTNCGNNATYAYELVKTLDRDYKNIVLIQDPTMQRRSFESFKHEWKDEHVEFFNSTPFMPKIILDSNGKVVFEDKSLCPWEIERFIKLIMGEIPRLRDDGEGYGPNGKGFIGHVDIPVEVEQAYKGLVDTLPSDLTGR